MALRTRAFGSTGAAFPEIGFGAWAVGGDEYGDPHRPADDEELLAAIRTARELGVEVFDAADEHGRSEELLAEALGDQGHVLSQAGVELDETGRPRRDLSYLREALERSLERLGRDQVSLFQLHDPPRQLVEDPDTFAVLGELKDDGLTRWIGISVHHLEEALAVKDAGQADAVQLPVSILRQDTLDAVAELAEAGIAVVARQPLANGFLTGTDRPDATVPEGDTRQAWPEHDARAMSDMAQQAAAILEAHGIQDPRAGALAFVLAHEVSVVLPGARTPEQVRQNVQGPQEIGRLPSACLQELYDLWDEA